MDLGSVVAVVSGAAAMGAGVWKSVHLHGSKYQLPVGTRIAGERVDAAAQSDVVRFRSRGKKMERVERGESAGSEPTPAH
jgi:hypothetical protein